MLQNTTDRKYYFDIKGEIVPNEVAMAAKLLDDHVLTVDCHNYCDDDGGIAGKTLTLFLQCNDVFAWACADSEAVTLDELPDLFKLYMDNPDCGEIQWICIKRNQKPQLPVIDWLKAYNGWTEQLDKLPDNMYDLMRQRQFNIKQ